MNSPLMECATGAPRASPLVYPNKTTPCTRALAFVEASGGAPIARYGEAVLPIAWAPSSTYRPPPPCSQETLTGTR